MVDLETAPRTSDKIRPIAVSDFKRISAPNAAALRLMRDPRLVEWLGDIYSANFRAGKKPLSGSAVLVVALSCPGGLISVGFPADLLPTLVMAIEADAAGSPAIAPLVASRLLAPMLDTFGQALNESGNPQWLAIGVSAVRLLNLDAIKPALVPLATWDVTLPRQLHSTMGLLSIDAACAASLQEALDMMPVRQYKLTDAWRVPTMLRIATRSWKAELLESLEQGDVLLCKEDAATLDVFEADLLCGALAGVHQKGRVKINHKKVTFMSDMREEDGRNDLEGESLGPPLSTSVAELEVPVHFEVDSTALSLSQLASLRPGYVIELAIPVQQAEIRLVACGQIIGRGKLVVIGDCLGVQLESLAGESI
ncbi:MAG: type III secretion system cytoplasmic ring protein SctQ [Pseudomonadota bacterium]